MTVPDERIDRFLPLPTPTLHILLALAGGERHGYGIMQEIERLSDRAVTVGPGTLYTAIKRLVADGLVAETDHRPAPELDDARRRYYRLTELGGRVCEAEVSRLAALLRRAGVRAGGRLRFQGAS